MTSVAGKHVHLLGFSPEQNGRSRFHMVRGASISAPGGGAARNYPDRNKNGVVIERKGGKLESFLCNKAPSSYAYCSLYMAYYERSQKSNSNTM